MAKIDQITELMRDRLIQGRYGQLGRLPSLVSLAEEFHVSRQTMLQVLQRLQAEGRIVARGGSGYSVAPPRVRVPGLTESFDQFLQDQGLHPVFRNLEEPVLVPADAALAEACRVPEGTLIARRVRVQGTAEEPYRIAATHYPYALLGEENFRQMRENPSFHGLRAIKAAYGRVVKQVRERWQARLATNQEEEILCIVRGTPVIELHRQCFDDMTVLMYNRIVFDANKYEFTSEYTTNHRTS
ncbi:DNA-binding GntR family transcriptional regulator [Thermosporothrix hazakensis]|jgi:GntR family transcriptional regulator|uniref:DNA-binding GntR family transcriptional regulator n=1 Tax=Thermosporothrix hazakensis TaxID=644383 RepID=A0A326TNZ4_THEHA|nr:GntR family transcriptional regulator [Thermosporothrix hazakensis]PZW18065.1 DNA-binding GntR family transcriptional regulator [Thermosporothrix hazakensis]GCE50638.1 hypothetical protein KTH_55070 [Thermosporothrix hazakensis]